MSKNCKEFLLVIVVTVLLVAVFSYLDLPVKETKKPSAMKFKGDSGPVLPGNGTDPVEATIPEIPQEIEQTETSEGKSEGQSIEVHTVIKEEHNKMDGMVIAFWHGVAAVLIGGAGALLVAYAWSKIKRGSEPK